jgi:hypothetical protein
MNNKLVDNFLCVFNLIKNFDKIILFLFLPFRSCLCIAFARLSIKNRKKTLNQIISKFFKHFLKDFSCEPHSYYIFSSSVNIFGIKKNLSIFDIVSLNVNIFDTFSSNVNIFDFSLIFQFFILSTFLLKVKTFDAV